jgi:hypothetical protein
MKRLPTGSGVKRAIECAASCVLSRAGHTGGGAVYGSEQHKEIEDGDLSRPVVRTVLEGATDVRHEVSYALDVERRTVREIGVGLNREYGPLSDTEIALTIDIECRRDGVVWVGDWKSRTRVDEVSANWQIRCAVMAVMARHSVDTVVGFLAYLDDSELEPETFDAFHVAGWWNDLRSMLVRINRAVELVDAGEMPEVNAGAWCQYCPALPYCPAHTRLALSMLGELENIDDAIASLTVEQCGRAWELLKRYDVIAERVRETIRARARREAVPLSNGRRLALVECRGRMNLDQKKAKEMLAEFGVAAPMKRGDPYYQVKEAKLSDVIDEVSDD